MGILEVQSAKEVLSKYRKAKRNRILFCLFFLIPGLYLVVAACNLYSEGYQERIVKWMEGGKVYMRRYVPSTEELKRDSELFSGLFSRDPGVSEINDSVQGILQARQKFLPFVGVAIVLLLVSFSLFSGLGLRGLRDGVLRDVP